ncbi:hypothetical protein MNV49_003131 [Pseudohyphozyma bogoriensis]|nr:hypothetical protein MNV49_003131 [Pseudohyphozyma bogoriensis]
MAATNGEHDDEERPFAVSDLKARFEQLSKGSSPAPTPTPGAKPPASAAAPPVAAKKIPPPRPAPRSRATSAATSIGSLESNGEAGAKGAGGENGHEGEADALDTRGGRTPPSTGPKPSPVASRLATARGVEQVGPSVSKAVPSVSEGAQQPPPLPPPSTRPSASSPATPVPTPAKKVPPPPPASRPVTPAVPIPSTTVVPPTPGPKPLHSSPPSLNGLPADLPDPSRPASSVKLLASRFTGAHSAPALSPALSPAPSVPNTAPHSPAATPPLQPKPVFTSELAASPFGSPVPTDSPTSVSTSDPFDEVAASPATSPVISPVRSRQASVSSMSSSPVPPLPPRPSLTKPPNSAQGIAPHRAAPPPIPARLPTSPPGLAVGLPAATSTQPATSPPRTLPSASSHLSTSSLPPPPLPPRRDTASTAGLSATTPQPARFARSKSISRPTSAASAPAAPLDERGLYVPPPPPSRVIAANERLAPVRPAISGASGEESSEDEEDDAFAKSQEFPDSTFANRRPPSLRNRKSIQSSSHFTSFTIRGTRVVTAGLHHAYVWHPSHHSGASEGVSLPGGEQRVLALEFRAADADVPHDDGRYAWGGTRDGTLFELDTQELRISNHKSAVHTNPVVGIYRVGRSMLTLDESGKAVIWGTFDSARPADLSDPYKVQRLSDKPTFHAMVGNELWTSTGPVHKVASTNPLGRSPQIRVHDLTGNGAFSVLQQAITTPESAGYVGSVTAAAITPSQPHLVHLAHDNGYISVWDRKSYQCLTVQRVSPFGITAMVGVGKFLWCGFRTGYIYIYDVQVEPWTVLKAWKAHKEAVTKIVVDAASLWQDEALQIASSGADSSIHLWDGLLRDDWIDTELHLRQREFCTYRTIKTLSISWNIDASRPTDLAGSVQNHDFLQQCLTSVDGPDIISFGFQEMIDLEDKRLTAKTMLLGKKKGDAKFADGVSSAYRSWHDRLVQAVRLAMPPETPYTVVHVGDMVGLFSCIFVRTAEREGLYDVALSTVKTGMGGRYGNKGAILARFVIDDSSLCFINCHLAAGQSHRRQRDQDLVDILEDKSSFSELASSSPGAYAAGGGGTSVFDHEIVILSGDLNYRIDRQRNVVLRAVQENNLASLLPHDQLLKGLATNQTFRLRSFKEAPITFAPTYKYDPGTDDYDNSAKKRIPAWCDRVLWRTDRADTVTPLHYQRYECNVSDHRPISAAFSMEVKKILPDKRAVVFKEVEAAWFGVESDKLQSSREYYGGL